MNQWAWHTDPDRARAARLSCFTASQASETHKTPAEKVKEIGEKRCSVNIPTWEMKLSFGIHHNFPERREIQAVEMRAWWQDALQTGGLL